MLEELLYEHVMIAALNLHMRSSRTATLVLRDLMHQMGV